MPLAIIQFGSYAAAVNYARRVCTAALVAFTSLLCLAIVASATHATEPSATSDKQLPRIAAITTAYYHNSHADVLISRLLEGNNLDSQASFPKLKLASLYIDQVDSSQRSFADKGLSLAARHQVPVFKSVSEALTLGGDKLAVDGVMVIAEHGQYPLAADGQIQYPKRRLWNEVVSVFESSGRSMPAFNDKHLADTWEDARWIYDASRRLRFPLMAGSSIPVTWRAPPIDLQTNQRLAQVVAVNFGPLEAYGFHALEALQAIVEKRRGGETGVRAVRFLEGDAVWAALKPNQIDRPLVDHLLSSMKDRPWPPGKTPEEIVQAPILFQIEYLDGLKASVLTLEPHVANWAVAWRDADTGKIESTQFHTQEARPLAHFTYLLGGVEKMMHTGQPTWPVERTLLTTGILDALYAAKGTGQWRATPHLAIRYETDWKFQQPPPPPADRPLDGQ